jgi:hypothetical protein
MRIRIHNIGDGIENSKCVKILKFWIKVIEKSFWRKFLKQIQDENRRIIWHWIPNGLRNFGKFLKATVSRNFRRFFSWINPTWVTDQRIKIFLHMVANSQRNSRIFKIRRECYATTWKIYINILCACILLILRLLFC